MIGVSTRVRVRRTVAKAKAGDDFEYEPVGEPERAPKRGGSDRVKKVQASKAKAKSVSSALRYAPAYGHCRGTERLIYAIVDRQKSRARGGIREYHAASRQSV